jgi:hypothetical protein
VVPPSRHPCRVPLHDIFGSCPEQLPSLSTAAAMSKSPLTFVILGETGVGKTSLTDRVAHNTQYHCYDPFEDDTRMRLQVGSDLLYIDIRDISLTPIRTMDAGFHIAIFDHELRTADGVVLLYDITSEESYVHVTEFGWDYVWGCRAPGNHSGLGYPLGKSWSSSFPSRSHSCGLCRTCQIRMYAGRQQGRSRAGS